MPLSQHAFSVIRGPGMDGYNFVNPPRRDVVSTGSRTNDNVTIRFVTDNPGPWFLHWYVTPSSLSPSSLIILV
jgi:iron transport multicopper oxidase